ncbi:FadR/GntR family transcriptional regulator [Ramlibacter sp. Leaf400]|uniref:FadR/GntR family transcriptional regulator n=1 Tax=Ramlibacter sp. Leaf400 TaxID=1736365 RepID=UPI0006FF73A6|nr:FadR/GntR family transcriptional regulator [Ramlibacter sp. Leaf400]KQT14170.1 GntR family transcriptional regulator [Ramlibacter sp. Leaf400]
MTRTGQTPSITRSDPESQGTGFAKVFDFLREQLLEGRIRSGDRLLPERELALQMGVSRPIVREALRALSMMGVVEIRERVGTVVRQPDVSVLGDVFAFSLAQVPDAIDDVMQARIALECQAIRLACQRATTADIERMRGALDAIEATVNDADGGGLADFEFHMALVRASRSDTMVQLYGAMAGLLTRSHRDRRALVEHHHDEAMKRTVVEDHRRLLEAVIGGDEDAADQALRQHFRIGDELRRQMALAPSKATLAAQAAAQTLREATP